MKIHHIGYLVKAIEEAEEKFANLGYLTIAPKVYDEIRKIEIVFLKKDGVVVELVSPVSEDSPVASLIKRVGNSPYHICYSSENFEEDIVKLRSEGWMKLGQPERAPALENKNVVFLIHSVVGMIEVLDNH